MAREFCHGVTVFPQPSPNRNPGGDCFACAVTAAMRHFFGGHAPTFDEAWNAFQQDERQPDGSMRAHLANHWNGMESALNRLSYDEAHSWRIHVEHDLVWPLPNVRYSAPSSYPWGPELDGYVWAKRLDGWLRAGHIALGEVRLDASETGAWHIDASDGRAYQHSIDHFLLYDGVRCGWRAHEAVDGAKTLVYQVHVVCSARGGRSFWIDVDTWLRRHGAGAGWWLIRPYDYGDLPVSP